MLIHIFKSVLYKLVQFSEIISEMPTLHTQHEQQKYTFNHRSCIILLSQKNAELLLLTLGHLGIL